MGSLWGRVLGCATDLRDGVEGEIGAFKWKGWIDHGGEGVWGGGGGAGRRWWVEGQGVRVGFWLLHATTHTTLS